MPNRAAKRCARCRATFTGKRCPTCVGRDAAYQADRADEASGFYHTAEWKRLSGHYLKHHPWCVLCEADGRHEPAKVADHYPKSRRQLLDAGIRHPDAWRWLRALCMGHHRSETNRLQPGGFIAHPERY